MTFRDRREAGQKLAQALQHYRSGTTVILAMPAGGVLCAAPLAVALNAPLDIVFTKALFHPTITDYSFGAVAENGSFLLRPEAAVMNQHWLQMEIERCKYSLRRQRHLLLTNQPSIALREKNVIIVDDGIAHGYDMELAIAAARLHFPDKIIVAAPVAPPQTVARLKTVADEVVVIEQPPYFFSNVGNYYTFYNPVTASEIKHALAK